MTVKSIDWEYLSRQERYCAKSMARFLYPEGCDRKTFNRGKFVLRSLLYRKSLSRVFSLFQCDSLKALPAVYPELLDKPMRPYRFACASARERAEMLGGKLTIESAPGKGTSVYIEVPVRTP